MAEAFRRVVGDQATLGYRQLPSIGAEGPDLRTLVYAGLGVALGILVGTVLADGSWRQMNSLAQHPVVQAKSGGSESAKPPTTQAVQTPAVQAQSTAKGNPQSAAPQVAAVRASAESKAPAVQAQPTTKGSPKSVAPQVPAIRASVEPKIPPVHAASVTRSPQVARNAPVANSASAIHQASVNRETSVARNASSARSLSGTRRVSAAHRHRPVHGMAGWKKHSGRHRALKRHRLHAPKRAAISAVPPATDFELKTVDLNTPFIFMVEGELTVSAYDALTGTLQTYEGETFALRNAASANGGIHGENLSPNIHYRCDRFGSCTLIAGQFVLDAQRTR
jgi:hypothetical protein